MKGKTRTEDFAELRSHLERRRYELKEVLIIEQNVVQVLIAPSATRAAEVEKHLRLRDQERAELARINQALHRLAVDEYGVCVICGDDIPLERLRALPDADHCVTCQGLVDHAGARQRPAAERSALNPT